MVQQRSMSHAVESSTLADVLERILDKGVVIAGDDRHPQVVAVDGLRLRRSGSAHGVLSWVSTGSTAVEPGSRTGVRSGPFRSGPLRSGRA